MVGIPSIFKRGIPAGTIAKIHKIDPQVAQHVLHGDVKVRVPHEQLELLLSGKQPTEVLGCGRVPIFEAHVNGAPTEAEMKAMGLTPDIIKDLRGSDLSKRLSEKEKHGGKKIITIDHTTKTGWPFEVSVHFPGTNKEPHTPFAFKNIEEAVKGLGGMILGVNAHEINKLQAPAKK